MKISDKLNTLIKGFIQFNIYKNGKLEKIIKEKNTVVINAEKIIRDGLNGINVGIKKIVIGDNNVSSLDDCSNAESNVCDRELVNKFFSKQYSSVEEVIYEDDDGTKHPALKFTFDIDEDEGNDSDNTDENERKIWCEYGLALENETIITRKIKPLYKDNETRVVITWTIMIRLDSDCSYY